MYSFVQICMFSFYVMCIQAPSHRVKAWSPRYRVPIMPRCSYWWEPIKPIRLRSMALHLIWSFLFACAKPSAFLSVSLLSVLNFNSEPRYRCSTECVSKISAFESFCWKFFNRICACWARRLAHSAPKIASDKMILTRIFSIRTQYNGGTWALELKFKTDIRLTENQEGWRLRTCVNKKLHIKRRATLRKRMGSLHYEHRGMMGTEEITRCDGAWIRIT